MRIRTIKASAIPPVDLFQVDQLSDLVVVAGPNGVGKSRLVAGLLSELQNLKGQNVQFIIEATSDDETGQWGKRTLDTTNAADRQKFVATIRKNQTRRLFKNGVLYYESNRSIQNLKPLVYSWEFADPWDENVPWNSTFGGLSNRFQDTLHALFKKVQAQKSSIAAAAINLRRQGHKSMNLDFSDPLEPFKEAFAKLLGPKQLEELDSKSQKLFFSLGGNRLSTDQLSSGEREVLNIAFDFILRWPSDCIVFFDEPELHLHPELAFKLIATLRSVGERNQFILCSHSPDLISSSLNDTVVCLTPPVEGKNQAVVIDANNETSSLLSRLGQSIGVIALGKKIVLVEGDENSLDKKVYSQLTRTRFQNLVILPARGKEQVASFGSAVTNLLDRTVWGVDFYLLCDRDAVPFGSEAEQRMLHRSKVQLLPRYHLENFFLDSDLIAACFRTLESEGHWLRDPTMVEERLKALAREMVSYAAALIVSRKLRLEVGNIDVMTSSCHNRSAAELVALMSDKARTERERVAGNLTDSKIELLIRASVEELNSSLSDGSWKVLIPGKQIVAKFCSAANIAVGRFINLYLAESEKRQYQQFEDIVSIFAKFSEEADASSAKTEASSAEGDSPNKAIHATREDARA